MEFTLSDRTILVNLLTPVEEGAGEFLLLRYKSPSASELGYARREIINSHFGAETTFFCQ